MLDFAVVRLKVAFFDPFSASKRCFEGATSVFLTWKNEAVLKKVSKKLNNAAAHGENKRKFFFPKSKDFGPCFQCF